MNTELKPLGKIMSIVQATSLAVSYAYDDLVFIEPNVFLFRFDLKNASKVYLHFNVDCETDEAIKLETSLCSAARTHGIDLIPANKYNMSSNEDTNELNIQFVD